MIVRPILQLQDLLLGQRGDGQRHVDQRVKDAIDSQLAAMEVSDKLKRMG